MAAVQRQTSSCTACTNAPCHVQGHLRTLAHSLAGCRHAAFSYTSCSPTWLRAAAIPQTASASHLQVAEEVETQLQRYRAAVDEINKKTAAQQQGQEGAFDPDELLRRNTQHLMQAVSSLPELQEQKKVRGMPCEAGKGRAGCWPVGGVLACGGLLCCCRKWARKWGGGRVGAAGGWWRVRPVAEAPAMRYERGLTPPCWSASRKERHTVPDNPMNLYHPRPKARSRIAPVPSTWYPCCPADAGQAHQPGHQPAGRHQGARAGPVPQRGGGAANGQGGPGGRAAAAQQRQGRAHGQAAAGGRLHPGV